MTSRELIEQALPEGYRYSWRFCLLPTLHGGRTVWLRSIPVLQRSVKNVSMGVDWGDDWVTVGIPGEMSDAKSVATRDPWVTEPNYA